MVETDSTQLSKDNFAQEDPQGRQNVPPPLVGESNKQVLDDVEEARMKKGKGQIQQDKDGHTGPSRKGTPTGEKSFTEAVRADSL